MRKQFFRLIQRLRNINVRPVQDESRVAAVALLIDGENISADFAVYLLAHAGRFGGVSFCRVYGNWAAQAMQRWQEMAMHYGMTPKHQHLPVAGKNATDIALVVDAMDMFHNGIRRFCLASGDSDYTPLVRRLVEQGCVVVVMGRPDTSPTLQQACTVFVSIEQLLPPSSRPKAAPIFIPLSPILATNDNAALDPTLADGVENSELQTLLNMAYNRIVAEKGNEWVALTHLGAVLKQIDPHFTVKAHGSSSLKALIRKQATAFQIQETSGGQAHIKHTELHDKPEQ